MGADFKFAKAIVRIRALMGRDDFAKALSAELYQEGIRSLCIVPQERSAEELKVSLCYHLWARDLKHLGSCPWKEEYLALTLAADSHLGQKAVDGKKFRKALSVVKDDQDAAIALIDKIEKGTTPKVNTRMVAEDTIAEDTIAEGTKDKDIVAEDAIASEQSSTPGQQLSEDSIQRALDNVWTAYPSVKSAIPEAQRNFLKHSILSLTRTSWVTPSVRGIYEALQQKIMFPMELQIRETSRADKYLAVAHFCCLFAQEAGGFASYEDMQHMKDWLRRQETDFHDTLEGCKSRLTKFRSAAAVNK